MSLFIVDEIIIFLIVYCTTIFLIREKDLKKKTFIGLKTHEAINKEGKSAILP